MINLLIAALVAVWFSKAASIRKLNSLAWALAGAATYWIVSGRAIRAIQALLVNYGFFVAPTLGFMITALLVSAAVGLLASFLVYRFLMPQRSKD